MKAPLPPNEAERLASLRRYEILDTPPETAFDDLAFLAAQICEVSMAAITFVDDKRQWFKSRLGLAAAETSRDFAFCAHTILHSDEVMEISDAPADARFAENPFVTDDPHIRFYAGAPLVAPDGNALGALCVIDRAPRTLSREQVAALQALSRHVVGQLEFRRQARVLADEVSERKRTEQLLRMQNEQLLAGEQTAARLLSVAERSRRALLGVFEDEQRAGRQLRESEERFRQLAENIKEVFWMTDPGNHSMLYVSPAYEAIWGRSCASLFASPRDWLEAIHPLDRDRVRDAVTEKSSRGDYDETYRIVRPDGELRWIRDRAFPVRNEAGIVYRIVGTAVDVTAQKQAELLAAVQHSVIAVLAEGAPLIETSRRVLETVCQKLDWDLGDLWTIDGTSRKLRCVEIWHPPSTEFRAFSETSRRLALARGEGLPGSVWESRQPRWISDVTQDSGFRLRQEAEAIGLRGAIGVPITLRNEVFGVMEFFSSRSRPPDPAMMALFASLGTQIGQFIERKHLEEQFRHTQKMEAIGTLAGGIAHDFNNVLAAISGYTELAKGASADKPDVMAYLTAVSEGSARAADLVRQILAFSRMHEQKRQPIQLWPVVEEALKLLRATIPRTIQFDTSLIRSGPTILGDASQIHQIVMNLATNASHAMKDRLGRIGVTLEDVTVDADLAAAHPGLRVGRYLRLSVSDTGQGMDQTTLGRIFDPFFTTKAPGEGTGLGLAVVHGIMQNHDGVISVYSEPGQGTQFHLFFPAHGGDVVETAKRSAEAPHGNGERILFVDDEEPLAFMGKAILDRLGYHVETHVLPAAAAAAVRAKPDAFDLVLTDLTMPGMTGMDLAAEILRVRPDMPIILLTGYSATLTRERVQAAGIREMVLKPASIQSLAETVQRVLLEKGKNHDSNSTG